MESDRNAFVEITISDSCNKQCSYCFEGSHCAGKIPEATKQLTLSRVVELCREFDASHGEKLTFSFWGGEPFMDRPYMEETIASTMSWPFVRYHVYSNGTLVDEYRKFLAGSFVDSIRDRIHIQLSYDGSPHNELKRGYPGDSVFETAKLLVDAGIWFNFKATLSFDMVGKLPEIWKSHEKLAAKFPDSNVQYFPTLDTAAKADLSQLEAWKKAVVEVAKFERGFILEHGRPLWGWFGPARKSNCRLKNALHVGSSGQIWVCHGAPYAKCNQLELGHVEIDKLSDLLTKTSATPGLPAKCLACGATHCALCHVVDMPEEVESVKRAWVDVRGVDTARCSYYKWFGYVSKLLRMSVARDPRGVGICLQSATRDIVGRE